MNNINQSISFNRVIVNYGKGQGTKLIYIDNNILSIVLDESHGLDILSLRYKGKLISLLTCNGLVNESKKFSSSFPGGMLYTCGLDSIGDQEGHYQHGNFHTISSEIIRVEHNEKNLVVEGKIEVTELFGINVTVIRRYEIACNSGVLILEDRIINNLSTEQNYVMLYHFNFGYPFLTEGVKIDTGSTIVEGSTSFAKKEIAKHTYIENTLKPEEEVYYHLDARDNVTVSSPLGITCELKYDKKAFPILVQWKSLVEENLALGIEPSMSKMGDALKYNVLQGHEEKLHRFVLSFKD